MTTTIHPQNINGRKRPSLGEQINRLDSMLDGLSEALNDAVADAVKVGVSMAVKEAVQAVLTEVLTNPEMRARLVLPAVPVAKEAAHRSPGLWRRVRSCIGYLRAACAGLMHTAANSVIHTCERAREQCATAWASCSVLWPFKFHILFALTIGVSVGVGVTYAEPWLAAITSGVGGFFTTLTVQAGIWLRKVLANDTLEIA